MAGSANPPRTRQSAARALLVLTTLALLVTACGAGGSGRFVVSESDAPFVPLIETTDIAVDVDRLVLTLVDRNTTPTFAPGTAFTVRYFDPVEGGLRFRQELPAQVVPVNGEIFYLASAPLDRPGQWELQIVASPPNADPIPGARLPFIVALTTTSPAVGDRAVASPTLTLNDGPLTTITSDPTPDLALYQFSILDALEQRRPFVVAFTTVGFCFGRSLCQRAVDQLKAIDPASGVIVIHAEPLTDTVPGATPVPSQSGVLTDWNLRSDPWIFVVDADGIITDRFEILATEAELTAALQRAAGHAP